MSNTVTTSNPRYLKLRQDLMKQILQGQAGTKLPTTRQLMRKYSVSQLVVDRCFFDLHSQGLVERRHRSGVFISPRVQSQYKQAKIVGALVLGGETPCGQAFVQGLKDACRVDKSLVLSFKDIDALAKELESLRESSRPELDGLICLRGFDTSSVLLQSLMSLVSHFRMKTIMVGGDCTSFRADQIRVDYAGVATQIVQRLDVQADVPLTIAAPKGWTSLAARIEKELGLIGRSCEMVQMGEGPDVSHPVSRQATVLVGLDARQLKEIISWRDVAVARKHVAIVHRSHDEEALANLQYCVLPYEEMGRHSYGLLCRRLRQGESWAPMARTFSVGWENVL